MYKLLISCGTAVCFLAFTHSAQAEILCVRNKTKATRAIKLSSSFRTVGSGESCPKGFSQLIDTSVFKGEKGDKGDTGAAGSNGANGANGQSAFDTLSSGTTIKGVLTTSSGQNAGFGTFSALVPENITASNVIIARNSVLDTQCTAAGSPNFACLSTTELAKNAADCTGTVDNPTAPSGKICIYPRTAAIPGNTTRLEGRAEQFAGQNYFFRPYFQIQVMSGTSTNAQITGTWAYTAP